MTFATRILGQSVGLFYYCRISGLPGIWGTCEDPGWDGWSPMLLADGLDEPIEEALEVWAGISAPSSVTLSIAIDHAWSEWLNRDVYQGAVTTVSVDCPPDYDAIEVVDSDSFAGSVAYIGLETVEYTGTTATSLTGLTRGLYGSHPQYHVAQWDGADTQSYLGAYVSDHPLVFAGRTLELWVGTYPTNAEPFSTYDRLVFKGIIESVKLSDDLTTIKIAANDIISLVESSAASRLPRGSVYAHPGRVWIDSWSCEMGVRIPKPGFEGGRWRIPPTTRLSALGTDGFYGFAEVASALGVALEHGDPAQEVTVTIEPRELEDGGIGTRVIFSTPLAQGPFPSVAFNAGPRSLWAELGFEGWCEGNSDDEDGDDVFRVTIDSEKAMPAFRRPPGATRPIWYELAGSLGFVGCRFDDLDGQIHGMHVRVGEQISRWAPTVQESTLGLILSGYEFGSSSEQQDPEPGDTIVCGLALQDIEWPLVILHLLCGGRRDSGTYSNGPWLGSCGMVPEALVDIDSFEAAAAVADRVSIWVDKATTIRELIEPLLVTYQYGLLTREGKITLVQVPLGLVSEPSVWDLDHDDIDTSAGIQWDIPEDLIVATIKAENVGYNWGAESGQGTRTLVNGTSLATWGGSSPLEVDMRAQRGEWLATDAVFRLADDLWPRWGGPFAVVTMSIASAAVWTLEIGDAVTITHTLLPDYARQYHTPSGTWRVQGWVYRRAPIWRGGSNRGTITVVVPGVDGARMSGWAPTALSTGALGAKTIPLDDASHFRADDAVRAYKEGDEDSAVTGTIGSIIGNVITIDSTGALTHPVCVEYDDWTVAVERQKGYVYVGRRYHYA